MSPNQFYALPQSPQTLKQLLMVAGYDKYFQIVRCFRDEDLRADRQPEFTQIDCEMSFVEQEDVLEIFERWAKHMFREVMGIELTEPLRRMPWIEAMEKYGSDKPDLRFGMEFADLTDLAQGHGFAVFDDAEYVTGFAATGCAGYTRKQIDALTEFVKRQQIGAKGLVWIRVEADGNVKSSVDKFYSPEQVRAMAERAGAKAGDLVLILCGKKFKTLTQIDSKCRCRRRMLEIFDLPTMFREVMGIELRTARCPGSSDEKYGSTNPTCLGMEFADLTDLQVGFAVFDDAVVTASPRRLRYTRNKSTPHGVRQTTDRCQGTRLDPRQRTQRQVVRR